MIKDIKIVINKFLRTWFYYDRGPERNTIFVVGSGRSGTTWVGNIISRQFNYRLNFEPFWFLHAKVGLQEDFFHYRHIFPDDSNYDYDIKKVLFGKQKKHFSNLNRRLGIINGRVVKDIYSTLFVPRIINAFPSLPIIYVYRHPAAVLYSRIQKAKWDNHWGEHLNKFTGQKKFIDTFFAGLQFNKKDEIDDYMLSWAFENYLMLKYYYPLKDVFYLNYEQLVLNFDETFLSTIKYIENKLAVKSTSHNLYLGRDNFVMTHEQTRKTFHNDTHQHLFKWRNKLSKNSIKSVYSILDKFTMMDFIKKLEIKLKI